jgi:hypothetical protein
MGTYKIGKHITKGVNLESAIESLGFIIISISPLWRGNSNGKYYAVCEGNNRFHCEWVEKINQLRLAGL